MMDLTLLQYLLLGILGLLAGIINMMAGGGSNLILPVLMMFGIPADIANGSNRVGVLWQSFSGIYHFHKEGKLPKEDLIAILIPTLFGGLVGALIASYLPLWILKPMLLITMLVVATVILLKPKLFIILENVQPFTVAQRPQSAAWLSLVGIYGGFVQAGIGSLMLPILAGILRYDLVRANAIKVFCTVGFTMVSLIVFIIRDQVRWDIGIVLAIGSIIGAKLGVKTIVKLKPETLRWILFIMTLVGVIMALIKG